MSACFELRQSDKLGRYAVASRELRAGEVVLSERPFALGPHSDVALLCFACHVPLVGRFFVCAGCGVAPVCAGDGCAPDLTKWHSQDECELFRSLKASQGLSATALVGHVGALTPLRVLLRRRWDPRGWAEFLELETHLDQRRGTSVWAYHENVVKFIESLGLLEGITEPDLVQRICAAIDVNSFDVRGPAAASVGCEALRGVYMQTALLAHDCVANTHMAISDDGLLVCRASIDIKKGEPIYFNYTDPMKGTALRQEHLMNGKYFKCTCARCCDPTELGTFLSSAICPDCRTGYVSSSDDRWTCNTCQKEIEASTMRLKVQSCEDKLGVINKRDEKELEAYIKNVSLVLAPNHYLLIEAKQSLAGVLRAALSREPRPARRLLRRQLALCRELLPVLETLRPGISRIKAITLYEIHATMVQLAKKLFDSREITETEYMDELLSAEKHLKRALEMLFIEPRNSPEGELCIKAMAEYKTLKATIGTALQSTPAENNTYVHGAGKEQQPSLTVQQ